MVNPIEDKRIVLIGGAGFIGHNLALYLKKNGADVSVIDGLNVNNLLFLHSSNQHIHNRDLYIGIVNRRLELLRKAHIPLYVVDARQYAELSLAMNNINPQVIVLLAAVAHANRSNKDPYHTFDHSLRTLENALDNARGHAEHFIYFSSSMVYGNFPPGGVTEDTPCEPIGIYGNLKLSGEKLVRSYNNVFDLPYTIVRPSALYGEGCISRRVSQIFIEEALMGQQITIEGDGEQKLDFTYVQDLVKGIKNIIENKKALNQTFNLTYGESRSLGQMASIIREYFPEVNIDYVPKDRLTPDRGTLSVDKARNLIGYDPQWPLEKGYIEYIRWYKELFSNNGR